MNEKRSESLRVQVTPELKSKVVAEAERLGDVSEAHVVRLALKAYFESLESEK